MVMSLNTQEREAAAQRAKVERANREEADWRLYCSDPEGARQRAAAERAQREGVIYRQQQPDWSAFWGTIDKRITEAVAAQYSFTKDQQELLFDILKDARDAMRGEISKAIEEAQRTVNARFEMLERRARAPGALPPVKAWRQGMVVYEGELASFEGQLYQAKMDTGLQPGDEAAFICAARRGTDGIQVKPRGRWTANTCYEQLNLVIYQDCAYLATRNDPGKPGDGNGGWQMIAGKGAKGDPGPRGNRGDRGAAETPVTIVGWSLDIENYRACPALNNGEVGAILDLRPLFERFGCETGIA